MKLFQTLPVVKDLSRPKDLRLMWRSWSESEANVFGSTEGIDINLSVAVGVWHESVDLLEACLTKNLPFVHEFGGTVHDLFLGRARGVHHAEVLRAAEEVRFFLVHVWLGARDGNDGIDLVESGLAEALPFIDNFSGAENQRFFRRAGDEAAAHVVVSREGVDFLAVAHAGEHRVDLFETGLSKELPFVFKIGRSEHHLLFWGAGLPPHAEVSRSCEEVSLIGMSWDTESGVD